MLVDPALWAGRRVFLTGHTGFKGGWLALWLSEMGARVTGFSLAPPPGPSLFEQAGIANVVDHHLGDIREEGALRAALLAAEPEVVFHLAAQPLVRYGYDHPVETFDTNVTGTAHLLQACRASPSVKAIVCVTSDKCYENREWVWPYRENDPMGGYDPYSASKGAAELVIAAFRRSYFGEGPVLASVRAGNVIGGGDWAENRLIPDIARALMAGEPPLIRSPRSVRPWQHVLEALAGYLLLAGRMLQGDRAMGDAWNFGPADDDAQPVEWIVERMLALWGAGHGWTRWQGEQPHEAGILKLDCSRARRALGWTPAWRLEDALAAVVQWYRAVGEGMDARPICLKQLALYTNALRLVPGTATA